MHKRLSLEMGGKNAQVAMDDADLDLALEGRCGGVWNDGATLYRYQSSYHSRRRFDKFLGISRTAPRLSSWRRQKEGTDVGPLINEDAVRKVETYVDINGQSEGRNSSPAVNVLTNCRRATSMSRRSLRT
jgi:aldehyde dehydrogenase (NAD+)